MASPPPFTLNCRIYTLLRKGSLHYLLYTITNFVLNFQKIKKHCTKKPKYGDIFCKGLLDVESPIIKNVFPHTPTCHTVLLASN